MPFKRNDLTRNVISTPWPGESTKKRTRTTCVRDKRPTTKKITQEIKNSPLNLPVKFKEINESIYFATDTGVCVFALKFCLPEYEIVGGEKIQSETLYFDQSFGVFEAPVVHLQSFQ